MRKLSLQLIILKVSVGVVSNRYDLESSFLDVRKAFMDSSASWGVRGQVTG